MMHPLNDALPGPYVPVQVTHSSLATHQLTYVPPRCRASQYRRTFVTLSVSLWNDLADPIFVGVGLVDFKSRGQMLFYLPWLLYHYYCLLLFFPFSSFCLLVGIVGLGSSD